MAITLEATLQTKLDQTAGRLGKSADEIASEAIRTRLEELDVEALEQEVLAYERLYPDLRKRYPNQVVAILAGGVVDVDPDFEALFLRIQKRFGERIVLIRRVVDIPVEEYRFRSPRLEQMP